MFNGAHKNEHLRQSKVIGGGNLYVIQKMKKMKIFLANN